MLNSDNLYPAPVLRALVELDGPGLPAYERDTLVHDSGFPPDRVAAFAAIEVDRDGYLTRIVEKPGREYYDAAGPAALISMNVWRFDHRIFDACRDVPLSKRGEYELPEAVGLAVDARRQVPHLSTRAERCSICRAAATSRWSASGSPASEARP